MSKLLRSYTQGDTYFVTTVTRSRRPLLLTHIARLRSAVLRAQRNFMFEEIAWVVLPDHYHAIIRTPNQELSEIMHAIKLSFSAGVREDLLLASGSLWQPRFWDHMIRDQDDFNRHLDYIHINPVKHGLVADPAKYEYSSFLRFLTQGVYQEGWGINICKECEGDFGE